MFSTDFIFRQQENLVNNQKCQAGFRPLCNKILFLKREIFSIEEWNFRKKVHYNFRTSKTLKSHVFQKFYSLKPTFTHGRWNQGGRGDIGSNWPTILVKIEAKHVSLNASPLRKKVRPSYGPNQKEKWKKNIPCLVKLWHMFGVFQKTQVPSIQTISLPHLPLWTEFPDSVQKLWGPISI